MIPLHHFARRFAGATLAAALSLSCANLLQAQPASSSSDTNNSATNASTTNDPRVGLKAGLYDAGEAVMGMEHLAFVKKPDAFQPPPAKPGENPRAAIMAQLGYADSDFAFQGTHLFQGNFYGINFYDISNPAKISLITSLVCPGGQGDVSVYGHLLFM
jgi:hypothetical protein